MGSAPRRVEAALPLVGWCQSGDWTPGCLRGVLRFITKYRTSGHGPMSTMHGITETCWSFYVLSNRALPHRRTSGLPPRVLLFLHPHSRVSTSFRGAERTAWSTRCTARTSKTFPENVRTEAGHVRYRPGYFIGIKVLDVCEGSRGSLVTSSWLPQFSGQVLVRPTAGSGSCPTSVQAWLVSHERGVT